MATNTERVCVCRETERESPYHHVDTIMGRNQIQVLQHGNEASRLIDDQFGRVAVMEVVHHLLEHGTGAIRINICALGLLQFSAKQGRQREEVPTSHLSPVMMLSERERERESNTVTS